MAGHPLVLDPREYPELQGFGVRSMIEAGTFDLERYVWHATLRKARRIRGALIDEFGGLATSKPAPGPKTIPPPPNPGSEPPAIAGQGYSLVFEEDFDAGIDTNIWRKQRFDKAEQPSKFSVANSIMTITNSAGDTSIDLMTKAGFEWQYAYVEGLMRYTANRASWASIWMMSARHCAGGACVTPGVLDDTKVCELDWLEANHQFETSFGAQTYRSHFGTCHLNTGDGCGVNDIHFGEAAAPPPNGFSFNYKNDIGFQTAGVWRKFGGLWTANTIDWYCDDVLIKSHVPFVTMDQPQRLFLAMYRHPNEGTATLTTEVDWVRVWQKL